VTDRPIVPRELAVRDIDAAVAFYLEDGGATAALGFIDAVEQAFVHIGSQVASGSPRYAHELNLPGLRSWPLSAYPYLVFYVVQETYVDVWRVLHGRRDIPQWMQKPDEA
jgi:toxin ParE1/3/4